MSKKRISFGINDVADMLEWRIALLQGRPDTCPHCDLLQKRIEKFIGKSRTKWLKKLVDKYPYFPKSNESK